MQRGCLSTGTKAVKSAPSVLLFAAVVAFAAFGGSTAARGRENHSDPGHTAKIKPAISKCMLLI
jgi:hypothetical protein